MTAAAFAAIDSHPGAEFIITDYREPVEELPS